jgi:hypothetical protein
VNEYRLNDFRELELPPKLFRLRCADALKASTAGGRESDRKWLRVRRRHCASVKSYVDGLLLAGRAFVIVSAPSAAAAP